VSGDKRPRRVALYTRVSTLEQTTALQVDEATRMIAARGWELACAFEDVGISGAKGRRPGLDALLDATKKRRVDVVVVWRADRLFRSVHHMVATLADFSAVGVDFVSCTEPFDTATPTGRLLFHLVAAFAQFERDLIIERTVAGIAAARRRGVHIGRPQRYVDVDRAEELRQLGRTLREVAKLLGVGYGTLRRALGSEPQSSPPSVDGEAENTRGA
jgi:DNA invertase Pin-like site-specific DNA recombinase